MNSPDRNAVRQEVPVDEHGKPIINTVAAVAIAPSGVGAELSEYVAEADPRIRIAERDERHVHEHRGKP